MFDSLSETNSLSANVSVESSIFHSTVCNGAVSAPSDCHSKTSVLLESFVVRMVVDAAIVIHDQQTHVFCSR